MRYKVDHQVLAALAVGGGPTAFTTKKIQTMILITKCIFGFEITFV
jgi:hypothetical protein